MLEKRFEIRVGRIRQTPGLSNRELAARLQKSLQLAGGRTRFSRQSGISQSYGRGFGAYHRRRFSPNRSRRAIVKTKLVRPAKSSSSTARLATVRSHLKYIERDSARQIDTSLPELEHETGLELTHDDGLFSARGDAVDRDSFLKNLSEDRHHFRLIISPEDAHDLSSLKAYTQDLMAGVEEDLGTSLEWVGINHFNTDHPHTHVILRGKDDQRRDLIISRDYISKGFRERAADHLSLELGPKSDRAIARDLQRQVDQMRYTSLDRNLERLVTERGFVIGTRETSFDRFKSGLLKGRLRVLETMSLAEERNGCWHLESKLRETLTRLGERGDIVRTMQRQMTDARDWRVFGENGIDQSSVLGAVVSTGLSDELSDHRYVVVSGSDGRDWYADIGAVESGALPQLGALVELRSRSTKAKSSDLAIDQVARMNKGIYSAEFHDKADGPHSPAYLMAHKRRLEALRRKGIVERQRDGSWGVPDDFLARVRNIDRSRAEMRVKSWLPAHDLINVEGTSVLDDFLSKSSDEFHQHGFGKTLSNAIRKRRAFLMSRGVLHHRKDGFRLDTEKLEHMTAQRLELHGRNLAAKNGKKYVGLQQGATISGTYAGTTDLPSGRYAVIETQDRLQLVAWKPMLERYRGQRVRAQFNGQAINWQLARTRALPPR